MAQNFFGEAWRDPSGLICSDHMGQTGAYRYIDGITMCQNAAGRLPSKEEYKMAEASGFREVVPNMSDRFYWTSTSHPVDTYNIYGFDITSGKVDQTLYHDSPHHNVRCVVGP